LESQGDPSTDPVLLWLNGGPGCSSLLGMITEVGAFVQEDGSEDFVKNPYAWNLKANLLFLESPVGVGFSYTTELLYSYSDPNTATDTYAALLNFFKKFPQYKGRDFFISGESYAGMYIPFAATAIVNGNKASTDKINLKGVLIGNGAMIMDNTFR
jgi:serine carboxypeptidase-like clade 2